MLFLVADAASSAAPTIFTLPPHIATALMIGIMVLSFAALVALLAALVSIWDRMRRKPPLEQVFATNHKLDAMETSLRAELRKMEMAALRIDGETQKVIENLEGRLHAQIKDRVTLNETHYKDLENRIFTSISENRSNNEHRFGELGGKVDTSVSTIQQLSNDLMLMIGELKGEMRARANVN